MTLRGYQGHGTRSYLFDFHGPHAASIRFSDGRLFHTLDLADGNALVRHHCGEDCYQGRYRVFGPHRWQVGWRIEGPRKRQVIVSRFIRSRPSLR